MKKLLLTFVVSVLVGSIATSLYIKNKTEKVELVEGYQINHKMPHFELKTLVGEDFDFKTVEGKNVVLNFFASWCPYCKEETPHLMTLQENHQDDLVVIMVNLNVLEERLEDVSTFQKVLDVTLPHLNGGNWGLHEEVWDPWYTYNVFINKDGVIKEIVPGGMTMEMLENSINNLN